MEAPKTSFHSGFLDLEDLPDLEKADLPLPPRLNATPVHTDIRQFLQSVSGGTKTPDLLARSQQVTPPNSPKIQNYMGTARRKLFDDGSKSPVLERVSRFL